MNEDTLKLVALLRAMLEEEPEWHPDQRGDLVTWEMHGQRLCVFVPTDPEMPPEIRLEPELVPLRPG